MAIEILKNRDQSVSYRANVYFDGKRYVGSRRRSKKEAELDEINQKRELLTGTYLEETKKTVEQGFSDYMELLAPKRLSYKALEVSMSLYKKHIGPEFGLREMTSVKPLEFQKFLTRKESELSNATIIKIYTLLNQIYKMMIAWNELKFNPLTGVKKPSSNHKEKQTWTKEECHSFLEGAREYQCFMSFWLALQFGLRLGEVQGLKWKNIDFENKLLFVEQAYHEEQKKMGRLKTKASKRVIPISDKQLKFLSVRKDASESDLIASNAIGGYLNQRNIRRTMDILCGKLKIKRITFHELRHTHATLLLEMNEHPKIVQQRLGHVKVETTLDIYSHVRPQVEQESAERFSDFFESI